MIKNEAGAAIIRIFLGATFFIHGLAKLQGGIDNTAAFFESLGLPGFTAYVVALIELLGGLALVLGIGTKIASILIAIIMLVATFKVKLAGGFLGNGQGAGFELDLALLTMAIFLVATNKSSLALDNVLFRSRDA